MDFSKEKFEAYLKEVDSLLKAGEAERRNGNKAAAVNYFARAKRLQESWSALLEAAKAGRQVAESSGPVSSGCSSDKGRSSNQKNGIGEARRCSTSNLGTDLCDNSSSNNDAQSNSSSVARPTKASMQQRAPPRALTGSASSSAQQPWRGGGTQPRNSSSAEQETTVKSPRAIAQRSRSIVSADPWSPRSPKASTRYTRGYSSPAQPPASPLQGLSILDTPVAAQRQLPLPLPPSSSSSSLALVSPRKTRTTKDSTPRLKEQDWKRSPRRSSVSHAKLERCRSAVFGPACYAHGGRDWATFFKRWAAAAAARPAIMEPGSLPASPSSVVLEPTAFHALLRRVTRFGGRKASDEDITIIYNALSNNVGSVPLADLSQFSQHGARPSSPLVAQPTSHSPIPVEAAAETTEAIASDAKPSSTTASAIAAAPDESFSSTDIAGTTSALAPTATTNLTREATAIIAVAEEEGAQPDPRELPPSDTTNGPSGVTARTRTSPPLKSSTSNGAEIGNAGSGGRSRRSPKIEAAKRLHFASTTGDPENSAQAQQQQQQRPASPRFLTTSSRHSSPRPPSPRLDRTPSPRRPSPRLDRTPSPRRPQGLSAHRSSFAAAAGATAAAAPGLVSPPAPLSLSTPRQTTLSLQRANLHHPSPTTAAGAFGGLDKHHHPSGHAYFASAPYGFHRGGGGHGGGGNFSHFPGKALLASSPRSGAPSTVSAMSSMSRQPSMQLHDVLRARLQEVVAAVVLQAAARRFLAVAKTDRAISFSAQGVGTAGARLAQRWVKLLQSLRAQAYAQRRSNAAALRQSAGGPTTLYAALHRREDSSLTITLPRSNSSKRRRSLNKSGSRNTNRNISSTSGGLSSPTGAEHAFSRDKSFVAMDASREDDRSDSESSGPEDDGKSAGRSPRSGSASRIGSTKGGSISAIDNFNSEGHSPSRSASGDGSRDSVNSGSEGSEGSDKTPQSRSGASASGSSSGRSTQHAPMSPEARAVTLEGILKDREVHIAMLTRQIAEAGLTPITEVVSLAAAEAALKGACEKLMRGESEASAQAEFDKWDTFIRNHPDHIAAQAAEAERWDLHEAEPNAHALEVMRRFVPPGIWHSNLNALFRGSGDTDSDGGVSKEGGSLPEPLARRIWAKKALWLVRCDSAFIARLHAVDLHNKFNCQGLDLVELRAVWAALPLRFENDMDERKSEWRLKVLGRLKDLVRQEHAGTLPTNQKRAAAYTEYFKLQREARTARIAASRLEKLQQNDEGDDETRAVCVDETQGNDEDDNDDDDDGYSMEPLGPFDPHAPFEPLESVGMRGASGASSTAHELQALAETRAQHLADQQMQEQVQLPQLNASNELEPAQPVNSIETPPVQAATIIDSASNTSQMDQEPQASLNPDGIVVDSLSNSNDDMAPSDSSCQLRMNGTGNGENNSASVAELPLKNKPVRRESPLMSELSKVLTKRRLSATITEEATVKMWVSTGSELNNKDSAILRDDAIEQISLSAESNLPTADSVTCKDEAKNIDTEGKPMPFKMPDISSNPNKSIEEAVSSSFSDRNDDASPAGGLMAQIRAKALARDRRQSVAEGIPPNAAAKSDAVPVIASVIPQATGKDEVQVSAGNISTGSSEGCTKPSSTSSTDAASVPVSRADNSSVSIAESQQKGQGTTGKRKGRNKKKK